MDFTIPASIAYITAWFALLSGIWVLFERAESVLEKESKEKLGLWLKNESLPRECANWPSLFIAAFDGLFTANHWSLQCFARSCIASSVGIVLMMTIVTSTQGINIWEGSYFFKLGPALGIVNITLVSILTNLILDCISLLETRLIIYWMSKTGFLLKIFLLIIDLIVTFAIFLIGIYMAIHVLYSMAGVSKDVHILNLIKKLPDLILFWRSNDHDRLIAIWFYTALFTSIWLWLFASGGYTIKLVERIGLG